MTSLFSKLNNSPLMPYITFLLRVLLGGLFIWSGVSKLQHMFLFQAAVGAYGILPASFVPVVAKALPWLEVMAGFYLIIGLFTRFASGLMAVMLTVFIVAISRALLNGQEIDCGCYLAGHSEPVSIKKLAEDVGLLLISLYLFIQPKHWLAVDSLLNKTEDC